MKLTKLFSHSYDEGGSVTRNYIRLFSESDLIKLQNYGNYLYRNKMYSELRNFDEAVRAFGLSDVLHKIGNKAKYYKAMAKSGINNAIDNVKARAGEVKSDLIKKVDDWNVNRIKKNLGKEWDEAKYMQPDTLEAMGYNVNKRQDAEKELNDSGDMDSILRKNLAVAHRNGRKASDELEKRAALEARINGPEYTNGTIESLIRHNNRAQAVGSKYRDHSDQIHPDAPYYGSTDSISKIINGQWGDGQVAQRAKDYVRGKYLRGRDAVRDKWNDITSKFKK